MSVQWFQEFFFFFSYLVHSVVNIECTIIQLFDILNVSIYFHYTQVLHMYVNWILGMVLEFYMSNFTFASARGKMKRI